MISISIFSLMMLSAFEVYAQVMTLSRKLEVQREVQESARAITEAIAKDVREKGFIFTTADGYESNIDASVNKYRTSSGFLISTGGTSPIVSLGYYPKIQDLSAPCFVGGVSDCALVKTELDGDVRLTSGRVRLTSLTFEEMGENVGGAGGIGGGINVGISTLPKVRLLMTLEARPGSGISQELIESTKLHIDTVFSTKMYKAD